MAAGTSRRCGFDKLLAELNQRTVLEQCLNTFESCGLIDEIWVVGKIIEPNGKIKGSITGGASRFLSVKAGIEHCQQFYTENIRIIMHNAANPFLSKVDLESGLTEAKTKENLIFGFFTPNSIKQVTKDGIVSKFLDREQVFETQTPQISTLNNFAKALEIFQEQTPGLSHCKSSNPGVNFLEPKDEAELLALLKTPIHVYECAPSNTKITFASDFSENSNSRIGIGEDSHRFADTFNPEKPFRLGGVDMSEERLSSDGNSDGDVILHALCNALLSAFGEKTFDPIAAPICAAGETNSVAYLKATLSHLNKLGHDLRLKQVLVSLEGAQPKIAPQHDEIVSNLAKLLNVESSSIGLTYTTGEGLNTYGEGLGIRSYVLITLKA